MNGQAGTAGTGGVRNILSQFGDDGDRTPPVLGMVNISQIGVRHAAVNFADFREEESGSRALTPHTQCTRGAVQCTHHRVHTPSATCSSCMPSPGARRDAATAGRR